MKRDVIAAGLDETDDDSRDDSPGEEAASSAAAKASPTEPGRKRKKIDPVRS